MPPEIFVSTHVHTDGPIPGPHSLLTIASVAHTADGSPISTFDAKLRELPGATPHPSALHHWRTRPEEWLSTRRASRPPAPVTTDLVRWVGDLPGRATLVTDPHDSDHLFLYWYLQRFAGQWPFARTISDPGIAARFDCSGTCFLDGCHQQLRRAA
ncbi:MAG: hypothetical protein ACT4RN_20750 [Pseudonocardia sp.]